MGVYKKYFEENLGREFPIYGYSPPPQGEWWIDDTVFEADVKLCFAMKCGVVDALDKKLAESAFGKYTLTKEGERFDYR